MINPGSKLCAAMIASVVSGPALAGHLFTQNVNNTPTWIQEGQGVRIDQTRMEENYGYGLGNITIDFAANPDVPDGADTSDNTWWAWSAGDVLRFNVPTADGKLSTTIAYDADAACAYDICGGTSWDSYFSANLPAIGTTNLKLGQADVSVETPLIWTLEALSGQFSLAGYRIYFANGTLNGTGAAPLDQTSVVDSDDLGGGATPDIDTAKETYLLSELEAGNVTTNFAGGTLTADANGTVDANFVVGSAGGAINTAGHVNHFTGQFSGDGGITKTGTGTLVLSGTNTQAGGTTVRGGTVVVSSNTNIGAVSAALSLDGGALAATHGFDLARPLHVGAGGGTLQTGSGALTIAGPMSGSGSLTLGGNFAIGNAAHTHTGMLALSNGTLLVNGALASSQISTSLGTIVGGGGSVAGGLAVAGTLSPGNSPGTLTVGGDVTLAPTATSRFEIDGRVYDAAGGAGTYDRLVLTGPTSVFTADGTLAPVLRGITAPATNSFTPVIGDSFRIVTTANGSGVAGAFATLAQPDDGLAPGHRFAVLYGSDYIDLVVAPATFLAFAETLGNDNAEAAAEAFDALVAAGSPDAHPFLAGLYGLDSAGLALALRQGSGEVHAIALDAVGGGLLGSARSLGEAVVRRSADQGFWLDASGVWSETSDSRETGPYEDRSGHLWVGRDIYHATGVRAGLAFGAATHAVDAGFGAKADARSYLLATYATAERGGFVLDTMLAAAWSKIETTREVALSTGTLEADGSGDVRSAVAGFGASHTHELGWGLSGRAWSRLVAATMDANDYDETGADGIEYAVDDTREGSAVASLGYEIGGEFEAGTWHFGVGLERRTTGRTGRTLSLLGEEWEVEGAHRGTIGFAAAGVTLHPTPTSRLGLEVGLRDGDDWTSRSVAASYSLTW